ncbi:MAG: PH domain-containing protein [Nostocaceae cyanobacterium]|nr:PH domain-containing protein [Nostocaceae cyanobacterium]
MTEVFKIIPAPAKTLWSVGIFALLMLAMFCLAIYIGYSSRHVQFQLSETELRIKGDLYGRTIPIASLVVDQAVQVELNRESPYKPRWRTNGIGLPGYSSGWFKLKNGEKGLLFVTDSPNVVYIPTTDNYSLLMSVEEPEKFLESLKMRNGE